MSDVVRRLVTRSDFDGLVCAVLLKEIDIIDEIIFVHPKDMQDGLIEMTDNDISTNLPYVEGVHLAFDHHLSETIRNKKNDKHIIDPNALSAARVVYDYYGGAERFPESWNEMMSEVDKADSAQFTQDEILHPEGWVLLNFIMDARTGLGRFHVFTQSNYQLMMSLIDCCRYYSINDILKLDDVIERVDLYKDHEKNGIEQIKRCATVHGNLVVLDLRAEETIYAINRFMIYALFPDANISVHVMWGLKKQKTVFAIGKSILNLSSNTNIGELCLSYQGGGHIKAGTCQVENAAADVNLATIIEKITADG